MKTQNPRKLKRKAHKVNQKNHKRAVLKAIRDIQKNIKKSVKLGQTEYAKALNGHWGNAHIYHSALRWMRRYGRVPLTLIEEFWEDRDGVSHHDEVERLRFKFHWGDAE